MITACFAVHAFFIDTLFVPTSTVLTTTTTRSGRGIRATATGSPSLLGLLRLVVVPKNHYIVDFVQLGDGFGVKILFLQITWSVAMLLGLGTALWAVAPDAVQVFDRLRL